MTADLLEPLKAQAADSLFPVDGHLALKGLEQPVEIERDAAGTPSIEARSLDDLWFAHGLVTAGERLFQLDMAIRAATGRLAEVFGPSTLDVDRFARQVGLHLAGARAVTDWGERDAAMHARFREGVKAWIAASPSLPIEYQLLGFEPDIPDDPEPWAACFSYVAWGLSSNLDKELLRARISARLGEDAAKLLVPPSAGGRGIGSNVWAVDGSRTRSGRPLLANDPHLPVLQPGAWLTCHLMAPGYDVQGVSFVFSPGVVLGATPHHAWGVTNVTGDVQDLYLIDEGGITSTREESISVRGEPEPRVHVVRETRFGPVMDLEPVGIVRPTYRPVSDGPYAIAWTGASSSIRPSLALDLATARSFDEFRVAVSQVGCPGQNFVYADVDGTIGMQTTGLYPVRDSGDGSKPLPDHGWNGWAPFDDLPVEVDPDLGYVVSANDGLHAEEAEAFISVDFHEPWRARRIAELIEAREDHDVGSMLEIQRDTVSLAARRALPDLVALTPATDGQRAALDALSSWDADMHADSREAAVYHLWTTAIARRALEPKLGEVLLGDYMTWGETWRCSVLPALLAEPEGWLEDDLLLLALDDTLDELDPGVVWGDIHRVVLAHPLTRIPGLEGLLVAADLPAGGDEQTIAQHGYDGTAGYQVAIAPSWRAVWDLADPEASVSVLPAGVSGNPASPHWSDQIGFHTPDGPAGSILRIDPA